MCISKLLKLKMWESTDRISSRSVQIIVNVYLAFCSELGLVAEVFLHFSPLSMNGQAIHCQLLGSYLK